MKCTRISMAFLFTIFVCLQGLAESDPERPYQSPEPSGQELAAHPSHTSLFRTDHRSDGNRITSDVGNLPSLSHTDVALGGPVVWVTGIGLEQGVVWAVVLENGSTRAFQIVDGKHFDVSISPAEVSPDAPPVLTSLDGTVQFLSPKGNISPFSHPVVINREGHMVYMETDHAEGAGIRRDCANLG